MTAEPAASQHVVVLSFTLPDERAERLLDRIRSLARHPQYDGVVAMKEGRYGGHSGPGSDAGSASGVIST